MSSAHASAGPSLAGRFAAAIALTIGFYVLALVLAVGLLAFAIVPWLTSAPQNIFLSFTALFLGSSILIAIVPRRIRFEAPGPKITPAQEPRLFGLVGEEARAAAEPLPDDVYLTMEANAAVAQVGRRRRVLIVGIPLLHILSERQLRGVLAHEFGHYSGGDTRLGPWIYRTRETIGRTIARLSDDDGDESWSQKLVRQPFIWYGRAFLRITATISRRQEFAADAYAVRRVGRATHVAALRQVHAYAPAFDGYWAEEVMPVLQSGRRPPIAEGFRRFIAAEPVADAAQAHLQRELEEGETDPYDSHPSLPERIAAVDGMDDGEPDESARAIGLLTDPADADRRALSHVVPQASAFRPVAWNDVGVEVYVARAEEMTAEFRRVLDGVTVGGLPEAVADIPRLAELIRGPDDDPGVAVDIVAGVLGDGVLLALHAAGWTVEAPPAEPVSARRGDEGLIPHAAVYALRARELPSEEWRQLVERLDVAGLPLGEPAHATA
jgi:Zn-dependent protease with chaperone function